jgi:SAM-dependent methyltransferase
MGETPLDPDPLRYLRHWEPVLAGSARRTLDRIASEPATLLDLGAGTGCLTLSALERWPGARVIALDASGAMLAVARSRVADGDGERIDWLAADAADIPLDDGVVDAVACSFTLGVVADRPAVLSEARRVLRPGGEFSLVTWLADDLALPADVVYHEALGDIDDDDEEEGFRSSRSGDYSTLEQARDELAATGFTDVEVVPDQLRYAWTAESYLEFKLDYDDHERIDTLDATERARLSAELSDRLADLPPEAFEVRGPLVAATARRPRE